MPRDEVDLLEVTHGSITAPAGCGKTELIARCLRRCSYDKPVLVLTHTNAGVAALRARLDKAVVPRKLYKLSTIDGFAMRLISTFPARSGHARELLDLRHPKRDYPTIRESAARLLAAGHIDEVIAASFTRLIVDEYQDCSIVQHECVAGISKVLPTCVLGDPLQAIFGFQGNELVDWEEHVAATFPPAGTLSTPWRWINAGEESFGKWLLEVRSHLFAGRAIDLRTGPTNVVWIRLDGTADHKARLKAGLTKPPTLDGSVLIIGDSTSPASQRQFASQTPGAVTVENVDLKDLVTFAGSLELSSSELLSHERRCRGSARARQID
jgi:DNA helicase-2/ATP-dependent DNA helicase PcrA